MNKFVFLLSIFFSFYAASEQNKIDYKLNWWVAPDGQVTKIYELTYSGERLQNRLQKFSDGKTEDYLYGILPQHESTDELIKTIKKTTTSFVFIFKGKNQFTGKDAKTSLPLLIPVYDDPVANYVQSVGLSKLQYRYEDLIIQNKVIYRAPWRLPYFSRAENSTTAQGLEINIYSARVEDADKEYSGYPGFDQPGAETTQIIKVTGGELQRVTIDELQMKQLMWTGARRDAAVIFKMPSTSSGHPEVPEYQWGGSICLLLCGRAATTSTVVGDSGLDTTFEVFKQRQFSPHFFWKAFRIGFANSSGNYGSTRWYQTKFDLATGIELRAPWITSGPRRRLAYVSLLLTPGFSSVQFSHEKNGNSTGSSFLESRIRWGTAFPTDVFISNLSLDFFYSQYFDTQNLKSDLGFGMVIVW